VTLAAVSSERSESRGAFVRSRLGSLLAVVPLGIWTVVHLWNNLAAFDGPEAWQRSVTTYPHPIAELLTMAVVLGPLVLHTLWGLARMFKARPNNVRYGYYANLKYALQRLSAIGLVLFLGAHLWLALLKPRLLQGHAETFADISHEMHFHGPTLAVYVLGVLGVAYHLANGLHGFCMGWGVVSSRKSLKQLEGAVIVLFLALLVLGWAAVFALWRAGARF
jgi:succinate dehydrogenase / fumarate reductase cytochrome b subunit